MSTASCYYCGMTAAWNIEGNTEADQPGL
jgi:hypothetical protein